jgi:hypothetical protein
MFETSAAGCQSGRGRRGGQDEREYEAVYEQGYQGEQETENEDQFFQALIPLAAKVLPSLLGAFRKEAEYESDRYETDEYEDTEGRDYEGRDYESRDYEGGDHEDTQAEEEILGKLLRGVFGAEAETDEAVLSPAQEADFAGRMMEVSDERELRSLVGKIVNAVGGAVQGVRAAARSPQGRAVIDAVTPVLQAADSEAPLFELESPGMSEEQAAYEAARQSVRLIESAARHAAAADPDRPAGVVGELSVLGAARRFAPGLFGTAARVLRRTFGGRFGRRFYGGRYGGRFYGRRGYGYGYGYRRPYRRFYGWRGRPRYYGYGYPGAYGYGYPVQGPEPGPLGGPPPEPVPDQPPAPRPGYRWIQVPIDAAPPEPPAPGPEPPPPPGQPAQSEWETDEWEAGGNGHAADAGRWVRRRGRIVLLDA